jgi:uncharacterized membrane protein
MSRFAFLVLAACAASPPPSGITTADITCPADSHLTYENFGKMMIADNCLVCHKADAQPPLNTLAEIQQNNSAILADAVIGTKMPKNTNMVLDERQFLGEWLACGAP